MCYVQRLHNSWLTLKPDKCINVLTGTALCSWACGIGPTKERVQAILEARELENITELRSFWELANYSSRFIPYFATLSEPLKRLTKKDTPYVFGLEQKTAFQVKQKMAVAGTLAYFDKHADTRKDHSRCKPHWLRLHFNAEATKTSSGHQFTVPAVASLNVNRDTPRWKKKLWQ